MVKKLSVLFAVLVVAVHAFGQVEITVPKKTKFADLTLHLNPDAQAKIQEKIDGLVKSQKYYQGFIDRAEIFFPIIERTLREEGVADEFKYLALQESTLKADAVSSTGAVGFWQFKDFTAIELGLQVDNKVDERKHIVESTRAAATYLKKNNARLNNWLFALLSYNLGLTGATRVMDGRLNGAKEMLLDKNTHPYIVHFLANRFAFEKLIKQKPSEIVLLELPKQKSVSLKSIAEKGGVDYEQLKYYNQWTTTDKLPDAKEYLVMIPALTSTQQDIASKLGIGTADVAVAKATMPKNVKINDKAAEYPIISDKETKKVGLQTIQYATVNGIRGLIAGDNSSIDKITDAVGMDKMKFIKINDLDITADIPSGQVYYLRKKKGKVKTGAEFHVTRHSETMWGIAQKYGIRIKRLYRMNRMATGELPEPGRILWVHKKRPKYIDVEVVDIGSPEVMASTTSSAANSTEGKVKSEFYSVAKAEGNSSAKHFDPNARFHVVTEGETLFSVAKLYKMSVIELKGLNEGAINPDFSLEAGQVLMIRKDPKVLPDGSISKMDEEDAYLDEYINQQKKNIDASGNVIEPVTIASGAAANRNTKKPVATTTTTVAKREPVLSADGKAYHKVRSGETLSQIAVMYDVKMRKLMEMNGLDNPQRIYAGQKLIVAGGEKIDDTAKASSVVSIGSAKKHKVKSGETLYGISRKYGVSVKQIMEWNRLERDNSLRVGDVIVVEDMAKSQARKDAEANGGYYYAKAGDNVFTITSKFKVSIENFTRWNNISKNQPIAIGQKLAVTKSAASKLTKISNVSGTRTVVSGSKQEPVIHKVKKGETLYGISRKYKVSVSEIQKWSGLQSASISEGQVLTVGYATVNVEDEIKPKANSISKGIEPSIGTGQSATFNGQKLPPGVRSASSKNQGEYIGETKDVPVTLPIEKEEKPVSKPERQYYTVKKGDTMYSISRKFSVSVNDLKILNNKTGNALDIGEKLRVK